MEFVFELLINSELRIPHSELITLWAAALKECKPTRLRALIFFRGGVSGSSHDSVKSSRGYLPLFLNGQLE